MVTAEELRKVLKNEFVKMLKHGCDKTKQKDNVIMVTVPVIRNEKRLYVNMNLF